MKVAVLIVVLACVDIATGSAVSSESDPEFEWTPTAKHELAVKVQAKLKEEGLDIWLAGWAAFGIDFGEVKDSAGWRFCKGLLDVAGDTVAGIGQFCATKPEAVIPHCGVVISVRKADTNERVHYMIHLIGELHAERRDPRFMSIWCIPIYETEARARAGMDNYVKDSAGNDAIQAAPFREKQMLAWWLNGHRQTFATPDKFAEEYSVTMKAGRFVDPSQTDYPVRTVYGYVTEYMNGDATYFNLITRDCQSFSTWLTNKVAGSKVADKTNEYEPLLLANARLKMNDGEDLDRIIKELDLEGTNEDGSDVIASSLKALEGDLNRFEQLVA